MDNDTKALFEAYKQLNDDRIPSFNSDNEGDSNFDRNNFFRKKDKEENLNRIKDIKIEEPKEPSMKAVDIPINVSNFMDWCNQTDKEGTYRYYNKELKKRDWYLAHQMLGKQDLYALIKTTFDDNGKPSYKIKYFFKDENEAINFIEKNILK